MPDIKKLPRAPEPPERGRAVEVTGTVVSVKERLNPAWRPVWGVVVKTRGGQAYWFSRSDLGNLEPGMPVKVTGVVSGESPDGMMTFLRKVSLGDAPCPHDTLGAQGGSAYACEACGQPFSVRALKGAGQ